MRKYFSILLVFLMVVLPLKVKALSASFWVSASATTVTRGSYVTISYGVSASEEAGAQFYISTSNPSVARISNGSEAFLPSRENQSSVGFTANQTGTATITFSDIQVEGASGETSNLGSKSITIRVVEPQSESSSGNDSNSNNDSSSSNDSSSVREGDRGADISVAPPNQETKKPVDEKSSNSYLSEIKIDKGELNPQFNAEVFDYTIQLPAETKNISVAATTADTKATAKYSESIELKEGTNPYEIIVTAENGSTRTYRINFVVEEKPKVTFEYHNKKIGVLTNLPEEKPQGYVATEIEINQIKVNAVKNDTLKTTLIYTVDESGQKRWMYFNNNQISAYEEFEIYGKKYILGFVDESKTKLGMEYKEVEVFGKKIIALQYTDSKLAQFVVAPLYNDKNELSLYQIDTKENTVQLFADSFDKLNEEFNQLQAEKAKLTQEKQGLFIMIVILSVLTIGLIGLALYFGLKRKK